MTANKDFPSKGGCNCRAVRYRMTSKPLFVHCCHCRWCHRETGTAFALNALIEADRVLILKGTPELVNTPSQSGKGQKIARCPTCHSALWSNYASAGDAIRCASCGSARSTSRTVCRPTSISTPRPSSHGWCCRQARLPSMNFPISRSIGRRRASLGGGRCALRFLLRVQLLDRSDSASRGQGSSVPRQVSSSSASCGSSTIGAGIQLANSSARLSGVSRLMRPSTPVR